MARQFIFEGLATPPTTEPFILEYYDQEGRLVIEESLVHTYIEALQYALYCEGPADPRD
jgi:hypothetical protein